MQQLKLYKYKGFTLIELLVVIAIIAILAAILFPIFASAKVAAKKAATISNFKQISTAIHIYMGDSDDVVPISGGCNLTSSLNPVHHAPAYNAAAAQGCAFPGPGGTTGYNRMDVTRWQKWIAPYMKNLEVLGSKMRARHEDQYRLRGMIASQIYLNAGFFGSIDVDPFTGVMNPASTSRPWYGGQFTALENSSAAGFLIEFKSVQGFVPPLNVRGTRTDNGWICRPELRRNFYEPYLKRLRGAGSEYARCFAGWEDRIDTSRAIQGGLIAGFGDSSVKFLSAGKFLSLIPTEADMGHAPGGSYGWGNMCVLLDPAQSTHMELNPPPINLDTLNFPFVGLNGQS